MNGGKPGIANRTRGDFEFDALHAAAWEYDGALTGSPRSL
jgi:hypothetical protein